MVISICFTIQLFLHFVRICVLFCFVGQSNSKQTELMVSVFWTTNGFRWRSRNQLSLCIQKNIPSFYYTWTMQVKMNPIIALLPLDPCHIDQNSICKLISIPNSHFSFFVRHQPPSSFPMNQLLRSTTLGNGYFTQISLLHQKWSEWHRVFRSQYNSNVIVFNIVPYICDYFREFLRVYEAIWNYVIVINAIFNQSNVGLAPMNAYQSAQQFQKSELDEKITRDWCDLLDSLTILQ